MAIEKKEFGVLDNKKIYLFTLSNANGMEVKIMNYGGIITSIKMKDKNNEIKDVVLGYDSFSDYLEEHPYFGAIIGRFGNRIANAEFELNGEKYNLCQNNEKNNLHGGEKGFDKVVWESEIIENSLRLTYTSPDLEEGFPGTLKASVIYTLSEDNELIIDYIAQTDKDTVINLTNHSYFNLNGRDDTSILNHKLKINADFYTPTDSESIPTGEIKSVANTPFDFREFHCIGERILSDNEQLKFANGYDHNYVLNEKSKELKSVAILKGDKSGIIMEVITTEPGIQFYTGNYLELAFNKYNHRAGVCLETQHYPDSPNQPNFPTTVLKKDDIYKSKTIYNFINN